MKAKEFDKKFDAGKSVLQHLEMDKAVRPGEEQRRVNVDFGGGPQNLDSVLSSDSDPNGRIRDEQET